MPWDWFSHSSGYTTCRTEVNFYTSVAAACTLFSGGGRRLWGFARQHVPVLELTPNESLQSPQSKGSCPPPPLCFSQLIQLSPCLTTRWPLVPPSPPPTHLLSSNSQLLSAGDAHAIPNLFWLPQLTYDPFLPCPCFTSLQPVSLIVSESRRAHAWYSSQLSSCQVCFTYTFARKLGQQGFEGHSSWKWLHFA